MLIITPSAIADIGFQLSFMALLGLVYLLPAIRQFFNISQSLSLLGWRENLLTTASAQLMVLPLILFYFSYFSPFSLIANVLILESVPYTMLLGLFIALFSWLGPAGSIITDLISYPAHFLLAYQIKVINIFAQFNLFSFTTNSLKIYLIIFFYLLIFFFIKNTLYPKTHSLS